MPIRIIVSFVTLILLAIVVFLSWGELVHAWELLGQVNIWILLLIIPLQFISYFATGETIFTYLRAKGYGKKLSPLTSARLAFEMNFVSHILPSGGVSGVSYMAWRLKHYDVSYSQSTTAQLVRMITGFAGFLAVIAAAVLFIVIDGSINRWIALFCGILGGVTVVLLIGVLYALQKESRFRRIAAAIVKTGNGAIRLATLGRSEKRIDADPIHKFFVDIHRNYLEVKKDKTVLLKPFIWGIIFFVADVAAFYVAYWSLGYLISPAVLAIACGLAAFAGFLMITPGGAGAYEVILAGFLGVAGVPPAVAVAGTLLARVVLIVGTIVFGYVFYQQAIIKHGKRNTTS